MSNFICSECGMTNIDCGRDGYKTPKEIELEKKVHILNEANMKLENELGHFADLSKKVERLQELLSQEETRIRSLLERIGDAETIFKIIKRNMEKPNWHKDRSLTELEIAIKSQVVGYLTKWGVK